MLWLRAYLLFDGVVISSIHRHDTCVSGAKTRTVNHTIIYFGMIKKDRPPFFQVVLSILLDPSTAEWVMQAAPTIMSSHIVG